jgi:hypothetical protein
MGKFATGREMSPGTQTTPPGRGSHGLFIVTRAATSGAAIRRRSRVEIARRRREQLELGV